MRDDKDVFGFEGKNKEKFEFEVPILPLVIGGALLIILFFIILAWDDVKITTGIIFGSEIAKYKQECKTQCELMDKEIYCCSPKGIYIDDKNEVYTCQNDILKTACELDCWNVCYNLCKEKTDMISCAEAGCSWIVGDFKKTQGVGGYCKAREGT